MYAKVQQKLGKLLHWIAAHMMALLSGMCNKSK